MPKKDLKEHRFENQHADEELLMMFRQHPIVMRKGFIATLVLMTIGLVPVIIWPLRIGYLWFGALGFGLGALYLFWEWIGWYYSVNYVTDQRVLQVKHKGLFNRSVSDIGLDKIQSINFKVSGMQATMFKYGTIIIQMYGGEIVMEKVYQAQKIAEGIAKIIKELGFGGKFAGILTDNKQDKNNE